VATGSLFGGRPTPWDAPVSRLEAGVGYKPHRHLLLKGVYQQNWRDTAVFHTLGVVAAQVSLWL
jgi:hypothetical protein